MYHTVMIISSEYTGHGHKSITEALSEQFSKHPDVKLHIIEGYALSGSIGLKVSKMYGSITRASRELWKLIWDISNKRPSVLVDLIEHSITESFLKVLSMVKPDVIIVTHPNYVSSVLNILEQSGKDIPLFSIVADPVTITPLWGDPRAAFTLCPTQEARAACMSFGVPEEKIRVFGFPVRERFCTGDNCPEPATFDPRKTLKCMLMSGGEGSGNMSRIARVLLNHFDSKVKIVCGRNKALKKRLELTLLEKYGERVEIFGFVSDIENMMQESDILFTRASPNVMFEAIMCNLPLVITGALPGQEEGNPAFAEKYGLGVICSEPRKIRGTVEKLLKDEAAGLNAIIKAQHDYRDPQVAKNIVDFIYERLPS